MLVDAFQSAIPMQDVPDHFSATKHQFEALYRSSIVRPLVPSSDRSSVRNVVFDRSKLDGLLEKVAKLPNTATAGQGTWHTISYAAQRGAGHFERIFRDVLEKSVPAYLHPEKCGNGAVIVDVASLINSAIALKNLPNYLVQKRASAGFFMSFQKISGIFAPINTASFGN
ncbi:MAG: hypothetical protein JXR15_18570 [Shimia sp.]|uniref:hypothetical protein n=1 Tax=Shimia sp. TaxID=1954381 RepID=UPI003B8E4E10